MNFVSVNNGTSPLILNSSKSLVYGIMGLTPEKSIPGIYNISMIERMLKYSVISLSLFSIDLRNELEPELQLGGLDENYASLNGGIRWIAIKKPSSWTLNIDGYSFNTQSKQNVLHDTVKIDSSTPFISLPSSDFQTFSSYFNQ